MISAKVEHKNPKFYEQLKLRMKNSATHEAAVGFPAGKNSVTNPHYDNGASIVEVAIWNNFGTDRIPRRPFMDDAAPKMQKEYKKILKSAMKRVNAGETTLQAVLKAAALKSEAIVREQITTGQYVPNAPATIAAKKSSKPLIDSGDMNKYVTSVVRKKK